MNKSKQAWADETSYSRVDTVRTPAVWALGEHPHQLKVHRYVGNDGWFVSCHPLMIEREALTNSNIEDAKKEAIKRASKKLAAMVKTYAKIGVKP